MLDAGPVLDACPVLEETAAFRHTDAPVPVVKVPAEQLVHAVEPVTLAKVSIAHGVQPVCPAVLPNCPNEHL